MGGGGGGFLTMTGTATASGDSPSSASNPNSRSGVMSATPGEKNLMGGGTAESTKTAAGHEPEGGVVACAFLLRLLVCVNVVKVAAVDD